MTNSTLAEVGPTQLAKPSWRVSSILLIVLTWAFLQIGGLFSPGLLDDVDSVYIEIAREMLSRHDFITPTIDGIRFFDKPPLMYWMAAASMRIFGLHDWAARLPLALGVLALLIAVYALGIRFFSADSPTGTADRGGLYAALATSLCLGTYLYTRFYIPDILTALWLTLAVHLFLVGLDRLEQGRSALVPNLGFFAVLACNVLTKGLVGVVFPLGFALLYLTWLGRLSLWRKLCLPAGTTLFLVIAAPWHILAAYRNPAVAMPGGVGLPAHAGWAWFYLYNEHVARFLQKRIPHDYGQVPVPLFWLLLFVWLIPWAAFVVPALIEAVLAIKNGLNQGKTVGVKAWCPWRDQQSDASCKDGEPIRVLLLWALIVLGFFTLSSRQEYYHLPALPALALLAGGLLARADVQQRGCKWGNGEAAPAVALCLKGSRWFLVPLGSCLFLVCGYYALTAPPPRPGETLSSLLNPNPDLYNLSLGHVFDLTDRSMGLFRGPLLAVALGMLLLGPGSHLLRRRGYTFPANLLLAGATVLVLQGAHGGLVRFYPILGSKELALAIQKRRLPGDLVAIDGELTSGSTLLFYGKPPIYLVNGRVNGPWFGSFWPDAPHIFLNDVDLARAWGGPNRVFLMTYHPSMRTMELQRFGVVQVLADAGGKTVLTNR